MQADEELTIWVTFSRVGFHCWPDAPAHRKYLASAHRHLFEVKVEVPVLHDDREVEFHDLLDVAATGWPEDEQLGARSCEMLARMIGTRVLARYRSLAWVVVTVSEDGEAGATCKLGRG